MNTLNKFNNTALMLTIFKGNIHLKNCEFEKQLCEKCHEND